MTEQQAYNLGVAYANKAPNARMSREEAIAAQKHSEQFWAGFSSVRSDSEYQSGDDIVTRKNPTSVWRR